MLTTNINHWEFTPSDNSHLFGRPLRVVEGWDCRLIVPMTREECFEHINEGKFISLERAGIDVHCDYIKKVL